MSKNVLPEQLAFLKLSFILQHHENLAAEAAQKHLSHIHYLSQLIDGESDLRQDRATQRRIQQARFPLPKTLEQFQWSWPKKINRPAIQHLFGLQFAKDKANVIFLGGVGLGKSHLSIALGYEACLRGFSVLFTSAIDAINTLTAAQASGRLKSELHKYTKPNILVLDEVGYLPINKSGADLLFQIISHRYERGSIIITTNRAFKNWPDIFNQDATLTSAILDRLLHHSSNIVIEGKSFRMKDQINE